MLSRGRVTSSTLLAGGRLAHARQCAVFGGERRLAERVHCDCNRMEKTGSRCDGHFARPGGYARPDGTPEAAGEEAALAFTGVTLTVFDLEKAFWKAMREEPLEINLPRWRGWLTRKN